MPALDLAAELRRHGLLAITDAQYRDARIIDRARRERSIVVQHRCRAAREDHAFRPHCMQRVLRFVEWHDLAVDLLLAHAARDELRHLRTEIDDENLAVADHPV